MIDDEWMINEFLRGVKHEEWKSENENNILNMNERSLLEFDILHDLDSPSTVYPLHLWSLNKLSKLSKEIDIKCDLDRKKSFKIS